MNLVTLSEIEPWREGVVGRMTGRSLFDYDATDIPAVYDRAREHGPEVLNLWLAAVEAVARIPVTLILDLGCGTGRFTFSLADRFGCNVIGLDPSSRMLAQARAKPEDARIRFAMARGEGLPLLDGTVDIVFMSMVFHHFLSPKHVARECRRVVHDEGVVFLRAGTSDRASTYPYVPFFPSSVPLLRETLPRCAQVCQTFEAAGFRTLEQSILTQKIADSYAEYTGKLEAGGDSVLARLDPDDLVEGLARIRAHGERLDPQPVIEGIDYFVFG